MIKFGKPPPKKQPEAAVRDSPAAKPSRAKFDRNAYQREYMRKRRAAEKAAKETNNAV